MHHTILQSQVLCVANSGSVRAHREGTEVVMRPSVVLSFPMPLCLDTDPNRSAAKAALQAGRPEGTRFGPIPICAPVLSTRTGPMHRGKRYPFAGTSESSGATAAERSWRRQRETRRMVRSVSA